MGQQLLHEGSVLTLALQGCPGVSRRYKHDTEEKGALGCGSHGDEEESKQILCSSHNLRVKLRKRGGGGMPARGRGARQAARLWGVLGADPRGRRVLGPSTPCVQLGRVPICFTASLLCLPSALLGAGSTNVPNLAFWASGWGFVTA